MIAKRCEKMSIENLTFWISLALQLFMHGVGVIELIKSELPVLKSVEYGGYIARMINGRLILLKSIINGRNDLLKEMVNNMNTSRVNEWA